MGCKVWPSITCGTKSLQPVFYNTFPFCSRDGFWGQFQLDRVWCHNFNLILLVELPGVASMHKASENTHAAVQIFDVWTAWHYSFISGSFKPDFWTSAVINGLRRPLNARKAQKDHTCFSLTQPKCKEGSQLPAPAGGVHCHPGERKMWNRVQWTRVSRRSPTNSTWVIRNSTVCREQGRVPPARLCFWRSHRNSQPSATLPRVETSKASALSRSQCSEPELYSHMLTKRNPTTEC